MLPEKEAVISVYDEYAMFGTGIFEMQRPFNKRTFKLWDHLDRLQAGCDILEIPMPYSINELYDAHETLLNYHRFEFTEEDEWRTLINVSRGILPMYQEMIGESGTNITTARYFRDKLAMRVKVATTGLPIPRFVHALNDATIGRFTDTVPPPWLLKPRSQASAIGIARLDSADALWSALETLGDRRSFYLVEEYVPGDIYHVDAIVSEREVLFAAAHKYGRPPMDVAHHGGIFITRTVAWEDEETQDLLRFNRGLLATLGFVRGVTHTEFIRGHHDGRFYFLETAACVGGAHIADLVEAATGLNFWREWARIEICEQH